MRTSVFFAIGLAGLASAAVDPKQCLSYAVNNIPACGLNCIISAGTGIGCGPADVACQCAKYDTLQANALNCVLSGCGVQTGLQVQSIAQNLCNGQCTGGKQGASQCLNFAINQIPSCGLNCIIAAGGKLGCGPTDVDCQCKNYDTLQANALNCVLTGCGVQTGLKVQSVAQQLCSGNCGSSTAAAGGSSPSGSAAETTGAAGTSMNMGSSSTPTSASGSAAPASTGGASPLTGSAGLVIGSLTSIMGGLIALMAAL